MPGGILGGERRQLGTQNAGCGSQTLQRAHLNSTRKSSLTFFFFKHPWSSTWKLTEVVYNTGNLAQDYLNSCLLNPCFCLTKISLVIMPAPIISLLPFPPAFLPFLPPSLRKKKKKRCRETIHFTFYIVLDFVRLWWNTLNKQEISTFTGYFVQPSFSKIFNSISFSLILFFNS